MIENNPVRFSMASRKVCIWCLPFLLLVLIGIYSVSNPVVCQNAIAQDNYVRQSLPNTAEEWLKFGDQELAAGKVLPAIDACKEAIRIEPGYELPYHRLAYLLGVIGKPNEQIDVLYSGRHLVPDSLDMAHALLNALYQAQRHEDFIQVSNQFLTSYPKDASVLANLGLIYNQLTQYEEAIPPLQRAIEIDEKPQTLLLLGMSYMATGRHNDALRIMERVIELNPESSVRSQAWDCKMLLLTRLGGSFNAADEIDEELRSNPQNARALASRAALHGQEGRIDNAIEDYKQAASLEKDPIQAGRIYFDLGFVFIMASRYPDAIEAINKSLELVPEKLGSKEVKFESYKLLTKAYTLSSRCEDALDSFEKAIQLKPNDVGLYNDAALCLMKMERWQDAERAFRYAAELDPKAKEPRCNLGLALLKQSKPSDAEPEMRACLGMDTADWKAYFYLGSIRLIRKDLKEASRMFRQALRLRPNEPMIMNNLGYTLLELDENYPEAMTLIQRAVNAAPSNASFQDSLGWAYFKSGKLKEAEKELLEASHKDIKSPAVFEHLGDVYQKLGKKAEAVSSWKTSLSLASDEEMQHRLQSKIQPTD
jgi:tetratricopeptide (TPR) repeat protein